MPVLFEFRLMHGAERPFGNGQVIVCQAMLADRVTANPTARLFAEQLLERRKVKPAAARDGSVWCEGDFWNMQTSTFI